jgi:hypothetical protein
MRPSPLALLLAAAVLVAAPSRADEPAPADVSINETAKGLYAEGQAALVAGKWAECRAKLLAAWGIVKHAQIAGPLGHCEVEAGHLRDGAEHIQTFLDDPPKDTPAERLALARELLARAKRGIATVTLKPSVHAAQVSIADRSLDGRRGPIYLEPGSHTFRAEHAGYEPAVVTLELAAGADEQVELLLQPANGDTAGHHPVWPYFGVLGVIGLGMGVGFTVHAVVQESDAVDAAQAIAADGGQCTPSPSIGFEQRCADYDDTVSSRNTSRAVGIVGFVVAGLGITTAAIFLATEAAPAVSQLRVTPIVGDGAGVAVDLTF